MKEETSRYVADMEIPDGILSIDCQIRSGDKTQILFMLNMSTCKETPDSPGKGFRNSLESDGEILVETERTDARAFIREILTDAYGPDADITLTDTDTD